MLMHKIMRCGTTNLPALWGFGTLIPPNHLESLVRSKAGAKYGPQSRGLPTNRGFIRQNIPQLFLNFPLSNPTLNMGDQLRHPPIALCNPGVDKLGNEGMVLRVGRLK